MALDQRKRQRKLEKKKAKQRANQAKERHRRQILAPEIPRQMVAVAAHQPLLETHASSELFTAGIGFVVVVRRMPLGGQLAVLFLVDAWCLGVKDVVVKRVAEGECRALLERVGENFPLQRVAPSYACKLVAESVAYARKYGLAPHADHAWAQEILAGIDPAECLETFEFGQDGKPFFVSGPADTPERIRAVIATVGLENMNYMVQAGRSELPSIVLDNELADFDDAIVEENVIEGRFERTPIDPNA